MMRRVPTNSNTSHSPNLLGAHRCTIFDGTCALPRVSCGGRCPCCPCAIGAAVLPLQRREQRLPHHSSSSHHSHPTRDYEVTRIVRLPEHNRERERLRSALKAMRAVERRIADAKVSQHAHFRRQQRWK
jgi:hypothetical protein